MMKRVINAVKACVEPSTVLNTQRKDGEEKSEVGANHFNPWNSRSCRLEPPLIHGRACPFAASSAALARKSL